MDKQAIAQDFQQALDGACPEFGRFFLARFFGLTIRYEQERCLVTVPATDQARNAAGAVHGGVLATALDISMGHLIHHVTGQGASTVSMNIQYMRPFTEGALTCEASFLKHGKSLAFMASRAQSANGKLVAVADATWALPYPR